MAPTTLRQIDLFGLKVNTYSMEEILDLVENAVRDGGFFRILTLNAEIAYRAWGDEKLAALINSADLVTADGAGILWAAAKRGTAIAEKVTGIDLFMNLARRGDNGHLRLYLLGSRPGVAEAAGAQLKKEYPGLNIVGSHHGYFADSESPAIARAIEASGADILICAMGAPRQDYWLARFGPACNVKVGIGVGGSLDVVAGQVRRAPVFFQKHGIEWFYRLLKEPWRFKRMLSLPRFTFYVRQAKRKLRRSEFQR